MVAQISSETFTRASHTPEWESSDSDDLVLALETARSLEAQGEIREAARWLRRAADQAEQDGNDERVLVLARAAADLANMIGSASSSVPAPSAPSPSKVDVPASIRAPAPKPAPRSHAAPPPTPVPQAPSRAVPPSTPSSAGVSSPRPVAAKPAAPSLVSPRVANGAAVLPPVKPATDRPAGVTMRVAIPASMRDPSVFVVRRLAKGQPLPPGTKEATLVLSGEDGSIS